MNEILRGHDYVEYRLNGILHRSNGPASIYKNNNGAWWLYGKRHRYYAPNIIAPPNALAIEQIWFIHGERIT